MPTTRVDVRSSWASAAVVAASVVVLIALDLRPSRSFDIVRLAVLIPTVVVAHELGHAAASWLLGHRVLEIRIGAGPSIRWRAGGTRISIGILPIDGAVASGSIDPVGFRWRRAAIIAAGPAMNAAAVGIVGVLSAPSDALRDLAVVNAWVLVTNLLPFSQRTSLGPQPNDGLALVRTLADPHGELEEQRAAIRVMEAQMLRERGRHTEARALGDEVIERFPNSRIARTWRGHELVVDGRFAEARHVFAALVEDDRMQRTSGRRRRNVTAAAIHLNNLAWADLMLDDPALIAEANAASAEALELLPGNSAVMGTRGLALIATKHFTEGLALAERALSKERDRTNRALQACVIAIGCARNWRFDDAIRWRTLASRLDPDCQLLARADRDLSIGRQAAPPDPGAEAPRQESPNP